MKKLKKGDPCPCCGQPIKTNNPYVLRVLEWVKENGRLPSPEEINEISSQVN